MAAAPDFLKQVTLFQDLDDGALATLTPLLLPTKLRTGAVVFREMDDSDAMYIVASGTIVVSKHVSGDVDIVLTRFNAGDFFGEMGLFDAAPRSATAQVEDTAELLRLDRQVFHDIFSHHPEIAAKVCYRLVTVFIDRLRATNEQAREAIRWGLESTGYAPPSKSDGFDRKTT